MERWLGNVVCPHHFKRGARWRTGVAHCPISNMKLSSGIARIPEMLKLGVPAVDGSASNDGSSLMRSCVWPSCCTG